ncbi:T9SS type A sorting domain-containing protein [Chryseobacterium formosus]|uniref:T9SS type A sorting domain-containing protein n=1 Tax=Chryseobacterium formosus TaxID=1537363 RepID=A0ABT3XPS2_9FLAO|nr:T9SS type A sorting domain-containing protein [Chryseobacterium formosus]MCX8523502.1 T9SS type A sorting domain-containing protein [Chryseobacterium formosus]
MKKILFTFFVSCFSVIYSQNLAFTDSKFKALILSSNSTNNIAKDLNGNSVAIDSDGDGEIQHSEAQQVKILTVKLPTFNLNLVPNSISDATKFTNVEELYIYHTNAAVLNYSNNSKIKKVKFTYNGDVMPTMINYSFDNCSGLQNLNDVITSPYTSSYPPAINTIPQVLTVKNCSQVNGNQNIAGILEEMYVENSPIANLTINVGTEFKKLSVPNLDSLINIELISGFNFYPWQGVELIANNCNNLQQIITSGDYYNNFMVFISSINVNGCSNLKKLKGLNYPNIDLSNSGLINLEELDCAYYNRYGYTGSYGGYATLGNVNSINLTGLPKLKKFLAYNQPMNTINFASSPLLEEVDVVNSICFMNNFDISNLSNLITLRAYRGAINDNSVPINLQQINAQNCTSLTNLNISGNYNLTTLNLKNCSSLGSLTLPNNFQAYDSLQYLTSLNLEQCTSIEELSISHTKINSLNTSDCSVLKSLNLLGNQELSQLNISNNIALESLFFDQLPSLTQLNTTNNVNLKTLDFNNCPLISQLDFSNSPNLEGISLWNMINLTSLNIKNNSIEQGVEFNNYNNNLSVCVDDAQLNDMQIIYPDINFSSNCSNLLTTVWNGTSWNNGTPSASINAIIDAPYSTTSNPSFTAKNITINKDAVLEITSGNTINAVDVTIKNNGNFIQRDGSGLNYTGLFSVKKIGTSEVGKYAFWSSPVASQNLNNIYGSGNVPEFITEYNTATDNFISAASTTSLFGKGYSIKTPLPTYLNSLVIFDGVPNNGTQTFTMSTTGNGFNLIGNPYPSNLDLVAFYNANLGRISNTFYFWDNTSNSVTVQGGATTSNVGYATYNPASQIWSPAPNITVIPTENSVKIGQGFIVKANNPTDNSLSFNNSMRVATPSAFYNKNNSATEGKFWLRLNSSYNTNNTFAVAYLDDASNTVDQYDSKAIGTGSDAFHTLASAQKLIIQGRESFNINDVVPVGTKHFQNGDFTISLVQKNGIFNNGQAIYLHDKVTGIYTNLQNNSYSFTANSGEVSNRFEIVYKLETLSTSEIEKNSFEIYRNGEDFFVRNDKNIDNVIVFDASGRKIQTIQGGLKEVKITLSLNGVYLVKATSEGKEYTKKIIK